MSYRERTRPRELLSAPPEAVETRGYSKPHLAYQSLRFRGFRTAGELPVLWVVLTVPAGSWLCGPVGTADRLSSERWVDVAQPARQIRRGTRRIIFMSKVRLAPGGCA